MLWELPIAVLNQGIHNFLHSKNVKLRRVLIQDESERDELAKILGVEF